MKKIVFILGLFICLPAIHACAQVIINSDSLQCPPLLDNVKADRIAGDSLASSFVIYIRKEVKPHKHLLHSEHVMVLAGEGIMTLSNQTFAIKKGSFIFIPKGTVHSVKTTSLDPLKVISIQAPEFDGKDRVMVE